jgi:hypothetical protein
MSRFRNTIVAGLAFAGALGIAATDVAEAKSISLIPVSCSNGTPASMIYLSSGSKVTVGFSTSSASSAGQWHVVVNDNGTALLNYTTPGIVPALSVSTQRTLAKGGHLLELTAENLTNGELCTYALTNKV